MRWHPGLFVPHHAIAQMRGHNGQSLLPRGHMLDQFLETCRLIAPSQGELQRSQRIGLAARGAIEQL